MIQGSSNPYKSNFYMLCRPIKGMLDKTTLIKVTLTRDNLCSGRGSNPEFPIYPHIMCVNLATRLFDKIKKLLYLLWIKYQSIGLLDGSDASNDPSSSPFSMWVQLSICVTISLVNDT